MPKLSHWLFHPIREINERKRRKATPRLKELPSGERLSKILSSGPHAETIIVVAHQASRTGAPILAHNIARVLSREFNIVTVLLEGGALVSAFEEISQIVIVGNADHSLAKLLRASPTKPVFAIVNSTESHSSLQTLNQEKIPTVFLIHEFASYVYDAEGLAKSLSTATHVVFSTPITEQSALELFPALRERQRHILPQGRCLIPAVSVTGRARNIAQTELLDMLRSLKASGAIIVIGAGTVQFRKGTDLFLQTAAHVIQSNPGVACHFVWIGGGFSPSDMTYSVYLSEQINRSNLGANFTFLDELPEMDEIYKLADIFFMSSRLDPLPNVTIDAASNGIPVVSFEHANGFSNLIMNNEELKMLSVPYLDSAAAGAVIKQLAEDPELRMRISISIKDFAARTFDMDDYVEKIKLLGSKDPARA